MDVTPTIQKVNNTICVKDGFSSSSSPEIVYNHWPIGNGVGIARNHIGDELLRSGRYGYQLKIGPYNYVDIDLINHEKTESIHVEIEPVPKPKTRVKTRWHNGRWEKLLKSRGWVTV